MTHTTRISARFRAYVVAALLCCGVVVSVAAEPVVELRVSTKVAYAPVKIRFTVVIEPDAANRLACLVYDSADGETSSSCWSIDANTARTTWKDRLVGRPGEYVATLTVARIVDGKVLHTLARTQFTILEPGVPFVR